jgi:hypothetical protein
LIVGEMEIAEALAKIDRACAAVSGAHAGKAATGAVA